MKVYAAVPAHAKWLWPLCQGQYEVKSTCKFIFIFPYYLPAYQSEAIKVVAGGFQPRMISKLAHQTLGWPQLTLRQKRRQISPYELFNTISQYIFIAYANFQCMCVISACKSTIVSPYKPVLWGTQNLPVLNLVHALVVRICSEHDCILHLYLYRSDRAVTTMIPG